MKSNHKLHSHTSMYLFHGSLLLYFLNDLHLFLLHYNDGHLCQLSMCSLCFHIPANVLLCHTSICNRENLFQLLIYSLHFYISSSDMYHRRSIHIHGLLRLFSFRSHIPANVCHHRISIYIHGHLF